MFADNTNLTCSGVSTAEIEYKLNSDSRNLSKWLEANKLTLNTKKTKSMPIASKIKLNLIPEGLQVLINDTLIEQVKQKEVLGIIIDEELKWKEHINAQCMKLSSAVALLRRAKHFVSQNELVRMYNSLVDPYFTYCSIVCNDGHRTNLEKLYKMQKRAARVITSSNYEIRSKTIFRILGGAPIESILRKREILMTFKAIRCIAPEYVSNMFSHHQNNNYEMRSNMRKPVLGKPKTNFMKRSFSYRAACAWNNLHIDIVVGYEQLSTIHFKILIDNCFL